MDNARIIWNSEDELFKNLQLFRTFGSVRSHCEIQGKISFLVVSQKSANVLASKCSNYATHGYTYDINIYLRKDRQREAQYLTAAYASDKPDKGSRKIWP
jgi:hypothetical protein